MPCTKANPKSKAISKTLKSLLQPKLATARYQSRMWSSISSMSMIQNSNLIVEGWFWGDPHIKTLDGGNYTFNGLGEYVMVDAQNGTFQLQARTKLAQGNSTTATIFSAGAAKEENTSTIEVRVKGGGEECITHKTCYI